MYVVWTPFTNKQSPSHSSEKPIFLVSSVISRSGHRWFPTVLPWHTMQILLVPFATMVRLKLSSYATQTNKHRSTESCLFRGSGPSLSRVDEPRTNVCQIRPKLLPLPVFRLSRQRVPQLHSVHGPDYQRVFACFLGWSYVLLARCLIMLTSHRRPLSDDTMWEFSNLPLSAGPKPGTSSCCI